MSSTTDLSDTEKPTKSLDESDAVDEDGNLKMCSLSKSGGYPDEMNDV